MKLLPDFHKYRLARKELDMEYIENSLCHVEVSKECCTIRRPSLVIDDINFVVGTLVTHNSFELSRLLLIYPDDPFLGVLRLFEIHP